MFFTNRGIPAMNSTLPEKLLLWSVTFILAFSFSLSFAPKVVGDSAIAAFSSICLVAITGLIFIVGLSTWSVQHSVAASVFFLGISAYFTYLRQEAVMWWTGEVLSLDTSALLLAICFAMTICTYTAYVYLFGETRQVA